VSAFDKVFACCVHWTISFTGIEVVIAKICTVEKLRNIGTQFV